jgi:hypothetical protein
MNNTTCAVTSVATDSACRFGSFVSVFPPAARKNENKKIKYG